MRHVSRRDLVRDDLPNNAPHPDAELSRAHPPRRWFPLADFAVGAGADIALPDIVEDIAEVIGRHAAVRLIEGARQTGSRIWRRQVHIPHHIHPDHPIVPLIGMNAARALSRSHASMVIELPKCRELLLAYEAWVARRWHADGWSVAEIAAQLSRSERAVRAMVAPEASL